MPITDACGQIWPSGKREAARDEHSSSEHRDLGMSLYALLDHTALWCRSLSYAVRAIFYAARAIFSISKSNTSKFTRGVMHAMMITVFYTCTSKSSIAARASCDRGDRL